jgi:aminoglycoside phosphotransferase (APT) family kinase protein
MALHTGELPIDEAVVRSLLAEQRPEWAGLPLTEAGSGTENVMFRLGDELLVRLPRTAEKSRALAKERTWLPRLRPRLSRQIPEPVYAGRPGAAFPLPWSVFGWIDGEPPHAGNVVDWAAFGADLAAFVRELHGIDLMGQTGAGDLWWYRGGSLRDVDWVPGSFEGCRAVAGSELDVDALESVWRAGLARPEPVKPHVWLHGDLRPGNLLVAGGRLQAVIDFGALSIGLPDAEHAPIWDFPAAARDAYRAAAGIDDSTWVRARAWAVAVGVSGIAYYWHTYPSFVAECRARLDAILDDATDGPSTRV